MRAPTSSVGSGAAGLSAALLGTHMGVNLQTEEDRAMHALLQDPRAMMDWIAVSNFLDAYR